MKEIKHSKELIQKLQASFTEALKYFVEDSSVTYQEFISNINLFTNQYTKSIEEWSKLDKQEKIQGKLETKDIQGTKDQRGILESTLDNLRSGDTVPSLTN